MTSIPKRSCLKRATASASRDELRAVGVRFERWAADAQLPKGADQQTVIDAYRSSIEKLVAECGYQTMDVIRLERGTPNTEPMRKKFLDEHHHTEDEVRFFVEGRRARSICTSTGASIKPFASRRPDQRAGRNQALVRHGRGS